MLVDAHFIMTYAESLNMRIPLLFRAVKKRKLMNLNNPNTKKKKCDRKVSIIYEFFEWICLDIDVVSIYGDVDLFCLTLVDLFVLRLVMIKQRTTMSNYNSNAHKLITNI